MKKTLYIIGIALMANLMCLPGLPAAEESDRPSVKRAVFRIESGDRWTWFTSVRYELSTIEGVSGVGGNILRKLLAVDYLPPLTAEKISRRISKAGFTASLRDIRTVTEKQCFSYIGSRHGSCNVPDAGGSCCPPSQETGQAGTGK